jgi:hypothetical protein
VGKAIIDGIWGGIQSGWDWLVGQVASLAAKLLQAAKDALGIDSSSKAFEGIGVNMMLGMEKGILEAAIKPMMASAMASQMAMAPVAAERRSIHLFYGQQLQPVRDDLAKPQVVTRPCHDETTGGINEQTRFPPLSTYPTGPWTRTGPGLFRVVMPEATTNLVINPSMETNLTGYTAVGGHRRPVMPGRLRRGRLALTPAVSPKAVSITARFR